MISKNNYKSQYLSKRRAYLMVKLLIIGQLILITPSVLAHVGLDSGLVAFYPFSRNANDSTGHGHNGVVVGASLTLDRFGRDSMAYDFNGITDHIQVADDSAWAFGQQPFTILLWANFRVVNSLHYIIGQSEGPGNTNKWMLGYWSGTLRFHINIAQGAANIWLFNYFWQPSVNNWYQIAVTREGNLFSLYVDSTLRATNIDTHAVRNANAPLLIGNAEGTDTRFNGRLDDVRIYNRALSIQEIRNLFSQVLTGMVQESEFPMTYSLSQNYPNPFNPTTKIKFDIPLSKGARGMITRIVIFDVLGREIAMLVNDELKPGTYEVEWDAENFPSGIYFYRLAAGDPSTSLGQGYSETRKMVLLK